MPRVYKLSIEGLKRIIAEEKAHILKEMSGFGPARDVEKESKKTKEVDADEHGTEKVHEKPSDPYKGLKEMRIREAKLLLQLKTLRESMRRARTAPSRKKK